MIRTTPREPSREELIALIAAQAAEIATLKARLAELERRLGLNSSNSSKPAVERWIEETGTCEQLAREFRQAIGRSTRAQGRHTAPGRRTRPDCRSPSAGLFEMRRGADARHGRWSRHPSGV